MSNRVLVIASGNAGKIREFSNLLQQMPLQVDPQPEGIEVEETGITFRDNALLKARAVAEATGHWALADDSGLSVDALGGAPGVYSARYADSDPARIQRLLRELGDRNDRQARFSAALCIAAPDGSVLAAVEGRTVAFCGAQAWHLGWRDRRSLSHSRNSGGGILPRRPRLRRSRCAESPFAGWWAPRTPTPMGNTVFMKTQSIIIIINNNNNKKVVR